MCISSKYEVGGNNIYFSKQTTIAIHGNVYCSVTV